MLTWVSHCCRQAALCQETSLRTHFSERRTGGLDKLRGHAHNEDQRGQAAQGAAQAARSQQAPLAGREAHRRAQQARPAPATVAATRAAADLPGVICGYAPRQEFGWAECLSRVLFLGRGTILLNCLFTLECSISRSEEQTRSLLFVGGLFFHGTWSSGPDVKVGMIVLLWPRSKVAVKQQQQQRQRQRRPPRTGRPRRRGVPRRKLSRRR